MLSVEVRYKNVIRQSSKTFIQRLLLHINIDLLPPESNQLKLILLVQFSSSTGSITLDIFWLIVQDKPGHIKLQITKVFFEGGRQIFAVVLLLYILVSPPLNGEEGFFIFLFLFLHTKSFFIYPSPLFTFY